MQADSLSFGRDAEPARGAIEQALAEARLQRAQPLGDDRGHHVERCGRACQAALVPHSQYECQVAAIHRVGIHAVSESMNWLIVA
jgi:hypothetical protein